MLNGDGGVMNRRLLLLAGTGVIVLGAFVAAGLWTNAAVKDLRREAADSDRRAERLAVHLMELSNEIADLEEALSGSALGSSSLVSRVDDIESDLEELKVTADCLAGLLTETDSITVRDFYTTRRVNIFVAPYFLCR